MNKIERMLQELCPEGVEYKKLGDVVTIKNGKDYKHLGKGNIPLYGSGGIMAYVDDFVYGTPTVLIPRKGSLGNLFYVDTPFWNVDTIFYTVIDTEQIIAKFLYYVLLNEHLEDLNKAGGVPSLTQSTLNKIKIPVPPLPIQEEIVRILDHFTELTAELQAELQARQEQYEYYNNRLLSFDDDIPKMKLNDVVTFMNGKGHEKYIEDQGAYIVVNSKFISTAGKVIKYSNSQISPLYKDMILMVMSDLPNGKALAKCFVVDADNKYTLNQRIGAFTIRDKNLITTRFLYYILDRNKQLLSYDNGADQTNLRKGDILNIIIPVPPLSEQQRIVSILDKFETLVNDLSQGLPAEITAVQEQYEYYRNKLLTFNRIKSN